jgi:enolase
VPETTDTFLGDLAVGLGTGSINAEAPARGENVERLNRLLDIEEELRGKEEDVRYAGREYRSAFSWGRGDEGKRPLNLYGY